MLQGIDSNIRAAADARHGHHLGVVKVLQAFLEPAVLGVGGFQVLAKLVQECPDPGLPHAVASITTDRQVLG